jgi:hypothetical protein
MAGWRLLPIFKDAVLKVPLYVFVIACDEPDVRPERHCVKASGTRRLGLAELVQAHVALPDFGKEEARLKTRTARNILTA